MNLRLEKYLKAQIQPSKRSNILEILQKAGLAEKAYSTVNPVILQWLVSIKLGNPKLPLCTISSSIYSKVLDSMFFLILLALPPVSHSRYVGVTSIYKTEFGVILK